MTNASDSVGNVPLDGHAVVEGPAGNLTFDWSTYGDRTDVRMLTSGVPGEVIAADTGHMRTIAWTLRQLGEGLEAKGTRFSFVADRRPGRPNPLVEGVVSNAQLEERWQFVQLRTKVPAEAGARVSDALPDVVELDLAAHWDAWAALHRDTLAALPLRGETTLAGVERLMNDPTAPAVTLLAATDPEDPDAIIGAVTLLETSSTPTAPAVGEIATIAVRPDWQRRGLGTHLVATALARFSAGSVRTALTYVDLDNAAAHALFAAADFKERGTRGYFGFS